MMKSLTSRLHAMLFWPIIAAILVFVTVIMSIVTVFFTVTFPIFVLTGKVTVSEVDGVLTIK